MQTIEKGFELPKFEEVIKIEVEVASIYDKLVGTFPDDYKHKEILAHAIVGNAADKGGIGYIYNALCGMDNFIDFKVGDHVICTETEKLERYDANKFTAEGDWIPVDGEDAEDYKPNWKFREVEIGFCKIIAINLYAADKLTVEFQGWDRYSKDTETTKKSSVNHKNCSRYVAQ